MMMKICWILVMLPISIFAQDYNIKDADVYKKLKIKRIILSPNSYDSFDTKGRLVFQFNFNKEFGTKEKTSFSYNNESIIKITNSIDSSERGSGNSTRQTIQLFYGDTCKNVNKHSYNGFELINNDTVYSSDYQIDSSVTVIKNNRLIYAIHFYDNHISIDTTFSNYEMNIDTFVKSYSKTYGNMINEIYYYNNENKLIKHKYYLAHGCYFTPKIDYIKYSKDNKKTETNTFEENSNSERLKSKTIINHNKHGKIISCHYQNYYYYNNKDKPVKRINSIKYKYIAGLILKSIKEKNKKKQIYKIEYYK